MVSREKRLVRQLSVERKNPIATDMFLPNSSKVMHGDDTLKARGYTAGSVLFSDGDKVDENNSNLFWDDDNNRLGIGTATPDKILHLLGNDPNIHIEGAANNQVYTTLTETAGQNWSYGMRGSTNNFVVATGTVVTGNEKLVIKTSGNVGMGTNNPDKILHLKGVDPNLHIEGANANQVYITVNETGGQEWSFGMRGSTNNFVIATGTVVTTNEKILIKTDGSVGIGTSSPVTKLDVNGGIALNLVSKTEAYTATTADHTIICGSGNESFTVTLPAATGVTGIIYNIKNIGTGTITIDADGTETIDGELTAILSAKYDCITIQCDGSNWHII